MGHNYSVYTHRQQLPPKEEQEGVYVVVDVFYFSSSVVRALENGATTVSAHPDETSLPRDQGPLFTDIEEIGRKNHPIQADAFVGKGDDAYFQSLNGARTVDMISDDCDVVLGSTINAQAVADFLEEEYDKSKHIHIVSAGFKGPASEDVVGVSSIFFAASEDLLDGINHVEQELLQCAVDSIDDYDERQHGFAKEFSSCSAVPERVERDGELHVFENAH